jgi:hypothetical protein
MNIEIDLQHHPQPIKARRWGLHTSRPSLHDFLARSERETEAEGPQGTCLITQPTTQWEGNALNENNNNKWTILDRNIPPSIPSSPTHHPHLPSPSFLYGVAIPVRAKTSKTSPARRFARSGWSCSVLPGGPAEHSNETKATTKKHHHHRPLYRPLPVQNLSLSSSPSSLPSPPLPLPSSPSTPSLSQYHALPHLPIPGPRRLRTTDTTPRAPRRPAGGKKESDCPLPLRYQQQHHPRFTTSQLLLPPRIIIEHSHLSLLPTFDGAIEPSPPSPPCLLKGALTHPASWTRYTARP